MDGDDVGLKEALNFSIEVHSEEEMKKIKFMHSMIASDRDLIERMTRTAYMLSHQEAVALENAIVDGRFRLRFESCPSPAIEAALERWDGHKQRAASGVNQCIRDILIGVAAKAKNGKKEE